MPDPSTAQPSAQHRIERLNHHSVRRHFDAFKDVAWDDPENAIDRADPRFSLSPDSGLGATGWYRAQPEAVRAEIGLTMTVQQMKLGAAFENILSRGLLELALRPTTTSAEQRYALHEVIEESQHSLMFNEFVRRSGIDVPGLTGFEAWASRWVPSMGRTFPELFFFFVLGGEAPIDYAQKQTLQQPKDQQHPLLRRIMRIHVIEEARHLCFATTYLEDRVPALNPLRKAHLRLRVPIVLGMMARQMLTPPRSITRRFGVPSAVLRAAYTKDPAHAQSIVDGVASVHQLAQRLELIPPRLARVWRWFGLTAGQQPQALIGAGT